MGKREEALLSEQLQRMADLGVEPAALPPVGAEPLDEPEPIWSPDDIVTAAPADEVAGDVSPASPDTSEEGPTREDGPSSPAMPEFIPNDGHYIGLRNGSTGPADEPAVTPAEERMIFGAPINRTLAEVEGTHGSPELDADAEKLVAMGQDPGPTLEDLDLVESGGCAPPVLVDPEPEFAEVVGVSEPVPVLEEADICQLVHEAEGTGAPVWAVGDLCTYANDLAEIVGAREGSFDLIIWRVALKKGGYEWSEKSLWEVGANFLSPIEGDAEQLFVDAYRQHAAAGEAESAARKARDTSDRLIRAHFALAEAEGALALIGKAVKVADADSTAA